MVTASSRSLPWMPAILALVFTVATHSLLLQYGRLHWAVITHHYEQLSEEVSGHLFTLLWWLQIYRTCTAALALACAVWALFSRPRWAGIVVLVISLFAILEAMIME
jgi:hypothetical protein